MFNLRHIVFKTYKQVKKQCYCTIPTLTGKLALVTGSSSGIGRDIAKNLSKQGCNLILTGYLENAESLENFKKELKRNNIQLQFYDLNLSEKDQVSNFCNTIKDKKIDFLINNAGFQYTSNIDEFPDEKWDDILQILLTTPFKLIKSVLPLMKKHNFGRLINIASVHGLRGSPLKSAYVSAKHGLVGLTKVVALECAQYNITCNAICPGFVDTPLFHRQVEQLQLKLDPQCSYKHAENTFLNNYHPNKTPVSVSEIIDIVLFLCKSGKSINGSQIIIDGGWSSK